MGAADAEEEEESYQPMAAVIGEGPRASSWTRTSR